MTGAALPLPGRAAGPALRPPPVRALRALSDTRLASLAADGDERAFEAIYQRHHQSLYRYCLSILRNPDDASDAVQTALTNALLALPAKKQSIALRPWLFRIAHNEAISQLRRRRPVEEIAESNEPLSPPVDVTAADRARLADLVDDLGELPERQRAALVMRELSAMGYDEIAVAFGTSPAAVKQAVYEARVALFERAEGRDMACDDVRRAMSEGDRRVVRGRRIRAHVRSCRDCRHFEQLIAARRRDLAALAPPLPPAGAAAVLESVLGGASGGGLAAGGAVAVKAATIALVAIAAGVGVAGMSAGPGDGGAAAVHAQRAAYSRPGPTQLARARPLLRLESPPALAASGPRPPVRHHTRDQANSGRGPRVDMTPAQGVGAPTAPSSASPSAQQAPPPSAGGPRHSPPRIAPQPHAHLPAPDLPLPAIPVPLPAPQRLPDPPAVPAPQPHVALPHVPHVEIP